MVSILKKRLKLLFNLIIIKKISLKRKINRSSCFLVQNLFYLYCNIVSK